MRVHLTQSSLSSSIRALERELGSDLFVRSTRRVELTEAGRALLPAARRAVAAAEDGQDAVAGVRGLVRGQLAIGVIQTQTVGAVDVSALLARYHRRHPDVSLRLHHAGVASLCTRPPTESSGWRSSTCRWDRNPTAFGRGRSVPKRCCEGSPRTIRWPLAAAFD
ncbi:MAG TPA: LysR family transcriptional regulator [Solirubrobacteraceae bacterium]|nr:LysR family transcriptional regulator [Solirubrobacteraceae bacterium]